MNIVYRGVLLAALLALSSTVVPVDGRKLYSQCNKFIECVNGDEVAAGTTTATGLTCAEACLEASGQDDRAKSNCCVSYEDPALHDNSCRSFTGKVCADPGQKSCAGFGSCIEATIGEVVDGCDAPDFVPYLGGAPSLNQINACRGSTIDRVISSCHGRKSCFEVVEAGSIQTSCIGDYSCFRLAWGGGLLGRNVEVIVDDVLHSCIGSYACSSFAGYGLAGQHHIPVPAHVTRIAYSCHGIQACHELPGSPITEANGSCNTNNACDKYDSDDVESVLVCKCPTSSQHTQRQKCVDAGYGDPENVPADRCIDPDGDLGICRGEGVCGHSASSSSPATIYTLSGRNNLGKINSIDGRVESYVRINDSDSSFKGLACGGNELYGITGGDNPRIVKIVESSEGSGVYEAQLVVSIHEADSVGRNIGQPNAVAVDPTRPRFMYVTNSDDTTKRLWRIDLLGQAPFQSFDLTADRYSKIKGRIEDMALTSNGFLLGINSDKDLYWIDKKGQRNDFGTGKEIQKYNALLNFPSFDAMALSGDNILYTVSKESPQRLTMSSLSTIFSDPFAFLVPEPAEVGPGITEEVISATICSKTSSGQDDDESATIRCSNFIECENGKDIVSKKTCAQACLEKTATLRGLDLSQIKAEESNCCYGKDACHAFYGKVCADQGQKSCYAANLHYDQLGLDMSKPPPAWDADSVCEEARIGEVVNGCIGSRACTQVGRPLGGMVGGVGKIRDACIGNQSCILMASDNARGELCPVIDEVRSSCKSSFSCVFLAWGGDRGREHNGSIRRIVYSCNAYKACTNVLHEKDVTSNEINGSCNIPFSCINYKHSQNGELICKCSDTGYPNRPYQYCQAYGSPLLDDPCLNPDGSIGTCGEGTCGFSSPPPPTCTGIGPIEDPALLPGGATETTIGDDEGVPSGIVHTYNIPYLLDVPNFIWRLESAFLTMDGNASSGTFLISNCNRDDSDYRLIVCTGYITVGVDGEAIECRLHIKLVFPTPVDVIFKNPDAYSTVPYLDVADLGGIVDFTAQTELFVYDNGLIPARLYFNNLQLPVPEKLYRSSVKMAFYYEPTSFSFPCPSMLSSSLDCVAANGQYLALDRDAKKWSQHMEAGNAHGLSLITAGEDENSEANVRVKMALSALSDIEYIGNGVWFAGKYNTVDSRWESSDGSIMEFIANPSENDYCALYDEDGPFSWANDSCDAAYMAIFEVPSYLFQMSPASGSCQIPTISFDQMGDTVRLSLLDPMGRSTTESDVSFSIAQTLVYTPGSLGSAILGIQANGEETQEPLVISTEDADADPTNELQTLSFDGRVISITHGDPIDISSLNKPVNLELSSDGQYLNLQMANGQSQVSSSVKALKPRTLDLSTDGKYLSLSMSDDKPPFSANISSLKAERLEISADGRFLELSMADGTKYQADISLLKIDHFAWSGEHGTILELFTSNGDHNSIDLKVLATTTHEITCTIEVERPGTKSSMSIDSPGSAKTPGSVSGSASGSGSSVDSSDSGSASGSDSVDSNDSLDSPSTGSFDERKGHSPFSQASFIVRNRAYLEGIDAILIGEGPMDCDVIFSPKIFEPNSMQWRAVPGFVISAGSYANHTEYIGGGIFSERIILEKHEVFSAIPRSTCKAMAKWKVNIAVSLIHPAPTLLPNN